MESNVKAPSVLLMALEPLRATLDAAALALSSQPLTPGAGQPVIVYPGLATNHIATAMLRVRLREAGFSVYDWEQGINRGPQGEFDAWIERLAQQVKAVRSKHRAPVALLGWSLGGIFAREVAKQVPNAVAQVVTLGTPFLAHPDATNAGKAYELLNGQAPNLSPEFLRGLREAPPVPTTSIYSRTDGVVAWQCSVEKESARTQNIEMNQVSHFGMVLHPQVVQVLAKVLAQPAAKWQRFDQQDDSRTRQKMAAAAV